MVKDRWHKAPKRREDRALCKKKYSCWAIKSPSRSGVLPETLRNFILKKHEVYQMERGHIDSMGRNMVQRSLI